MHQPLLAVLPYLSLSIHEAEDMLTQPNAIAIDVRTPGEISRLGHIKGAWLIPLDTLHTQLDRIKAHSGPKVIVCEHGVRSRTACGILAAAGVTDVFNMNGGMSQWDGPRDFDR